MSLNYGFSLPALAPNGAGGNNPFGQLGPTLDLSFADTVTDVANPTGYTLATDFITPQYQVATQYTIWELNVGLVAKTFGDIITYTRSGNATYFDATGTLQTAGANVPRFDYNPSTLAALGLLIEEQRTNSVANNTMQGAVAGTPGTPPSPWGTMTSTGNGITRNIIGVSTENGITYIEVQYTTGGGTTSASGNLQILPAATTAVAAASGQTWTGSTYIKLQAGSFTNLTNVTTVLVGRDSGGTLLENTSLTIAPTNAALNTQRYVVSRTLNNASTAFVTVTSFQANYASGVTIDVTLRIGLPQLEQGAFATSVIPTSGAAATRSADVASVNTLSPWFNATQSTIFAEVQSTLTSVASVVNSFNDGTANNRFTTFVSSTFFQAGRNTGGAGVVFTPQTANAPTANVNKVALAVANLDVALCGNGGTVATAATYNVPTVTKLELGSQLSGSFLNGWLRRLTYYPRRLSNAELQAITT